MKKLLLLYALVGFGLSARAQFPLSQGTVKFDFGAGYAKPTQGFGVKPGVALVIEPHYFVSGNFAVGARFEGALLGYQANYRDELFSFFGSTCFTTEVYLARGVFRPFVGAGGGLYTRHYIFEDYYSDRLYTSGFGDIKCGYFLRGGFEISHLRLAASYNIVASNFSYATFTLGFVIGGK